jgi:hypothetical protein
MAKRVSKRSAPVAGSRACVPSWIATEMFSRSHSVQNG